MPIDERIFKQLNHINEQYLASKMKGMDQGEIRKNYQALQSQMSQALAPMPMTPRLGGGQIQSQIPIAGFQGNSMFPNQAGSGLLQTGQQPPPPSAMPLNPMGQPMQGGIRPVWEGQNQIMAQAGQPGQLGMGQQGGFDTHIHIGADRQVQSIMLKRALQRKIQQQGGMA